MIYAIPPAPLVASLPSAAFDLPSRQKISKCFEEMVDGYATNRASAAIKVCVVHLESDLIHYVNVIV